MAPNPSERMRLQVKAVTTLMYFSVFERLTMS
jgi:hypothetical protein